MRIFRRLTKGSNDYIERFQTLAKVFGRLAKDSRCRQKVPGVDKGFQGF